MIAEHVNFCPRCSAPLIREERFGALRPVCRQCGWIYFADPKVAAAVVIENEHQVLLVRRVNEPERGRWSLPAGFVDAGEDPARAAERECLEETGLTVQVVGLVNVIPGMEHSRGAHIIIVYKAEIISGEMAAGDDVDAAAFFDLDDLPPLAFRTTGEILLRMKT